MPLSQAWIDGGCLSTETILQGVSLTLHQSYMTCAASARQAAYAAPCAASSEPGMEGYAGDRSADLCSAIHGDYLRCEDDHTDDDVDETYGQACPCTCAGVSQWSPFVDGPCDEASWPDLDHDLVCGECKVLVDNIRDYGTCDRYCRSLPNPRRCTGAWEEDGDSCAVESEHSCDWRPRSTSDALCECSDECTGDECGIALGPPPSFCEDDCVTEPTDCDEANAMIAFGGCAHDCTIVGGGAQADQDWLTQAFAPLLSQCGQLVWDDSCSAEFAACREDGACMSAYNDADTVGCLASDVCLRLLGCTTVQGNGFVSGTCQTMLRRCLDHDACADLLFRGDASDCAANQYCVDVFSCVISHDPCRGEVQECLRSAECASLLDPSSVMQGLADHRPNPVMLGGLSDLSDAGQMYPMFAFATSDRSGCEDNSLCAAALRCADADDADCTSSSQCPAGFFCQPEENSAGTAGKCVGCTTCRGRDGWCTSCEWPLTEFGLQECEMQCLLRGPIPCRPPNREDRCGICDSDPDNDCRQDCLGEWGGTAEVDDCGSCGGDNSGCEDCAGVPGGPRELDPCGRCLAPGDEPAEPCQRNCLGAFPDLSSGTPVGGPQLDACGVCQGDGSSCLDCAGVPNGNSRRDRCGICDSDPTNDNLRDCFGVCLPPSSGDWGAAGTPIGEMDACGVCDAVYCSATSSRGDIPRYPNLPVTPTLVGGSWQCSDGLVAIEVGDGPALSCADCQGQTASPFCSTDGRQSNGVTPVLDTASGIWDGCPASSKPVFGRGPNRVDKCDTCNANPADDCALSCDNIWGGTAVFDACGVCGGDGVCRKAMRFPVLVPGAGLATFEDAQGNHKQIVDDIIAEINSRSGIALEHISLLGISENAGGTETEIVFELLVEIDAGRRRLQADTLANDLAGAVGAQDNIDGSGVTTGSVVEVSIDCHGVVDGTATIDECKCSHSLCVFFFRTLKRSVAQVASAGSRPSPAPPSPRSTTPRGRLCSRPRTPPSMPGKLCV